MGAMPWLRAMVEERVLRKRRTVVALVETYVTRSLGDEDSHLQPFRGRFIHGNNPILMVALHVVLVTLSVKSLIRLLMSPS
jgi:hypothetical protein